MKYKYSVICFVVAIIITGCATPQNNYKAAITGASKRIVAPPKILDQNSTDEQGSPVLNGKITLTQALNAAMDFNPAIAATWYEILAARGAKRQSKMLPNPELSVEMEEFGGSGELSGTDAMATTVGISQEIPLGNKREKALEIAIATLNVAEIEHNINIAEVKAMVERRYIEVYTLQEQVRLLTKQLELSGQTHDAISKRTQTGGTSPLDLTRSQVELASIKIELAQVRKSLETARYQLAESWGANTPSFTEVEPLSAEIPPYKQENLSLALKNSLRNKRLELETKKAQPEYELAKAERIPDIEVEGGITHFKESEDHAFFIGFSIPLPLFDRNQGGIAEAGAKLKKANFERRAGFLALETKLLEAWQDFASNRDAIQSLDSDLLPAAQTAYEAVVKAYNAGAVMLLDYLDAQRTLLEFQTKRLELYHGLENSRIEIERLVGENQQLMLSSKK